MIVWEIFPGLAIGAVILAHGAPRALSQEGTPAIPVADPLSVHRETNTFTRVIDIHEGTSRFTQSRRRKRTLELSILFLRAFSRSWRFVDGRWFPEAKSADKR